MTKTFLCEGLTSASDCTPGIDFNFPAVIGSADLGDNHTSSVPNGSSNRITHSWTTVAGEPDLTNWINGTYRFRMNVSTLQITSYAAEQRRVASTCTPLQTLGTSSTQASTGTFTYDISIDPGTGTDTDRFQGRLLANNSEGMAKNFRCRTTQADPNDTLLEGPWTAASAFSGVPVVGVLVPLMRRRRM